MDTLLKDIESHKTVFGIREVTRYIGSGNIRCVIIASNADSFIKDKAVSLCESNNVSYRFLPSKEEIGKIAGLDVACAVIGFMEKSANTH